MCTTQANGGAHRRTRSLCRSCSSTSAPVPRLQSAATRQSRPPWTVLVQKSLACLSWLFVARHHVSRQPPDKTAGPSGWVSGQGPPPGSAPSGSRRWQPVTPDASASMSKIAPRHGRRGLMNTPLEDYALLSDLRTGPLVSRSGSIDWLCLPRFDSPAVFCALLGQPADGCWRLSVADGEVIDWRYRPGTFVLETTWRSPSGCALVTDFMTPSTTRADLVRRVECLQGRVDVDYDLRIRFDYARATPWIGGSTAPTAVRSCSPSPDPKALMISGPPLRRAEPTSRPATRRKVTQCHSWPAPSPLARARP